MDLLAHAHGLLVCEFGEWFSGDSKVSTGDAAEHSGDVRPWLRTAVPINLCPRETYDCQKARLLSWMATTFQTKYPKNWLSSDDPCPNPELLEPQFNYIRFAYM